MNKVVSKFPKEGKKKSKRRGKEETTGCKLKTGIKLSL